MREGRIPHVALDADTVVARRDGTLLRADVYRPSSPGRYPVLVHRTPYDKRVAQSYWYAPPSWYAERGYAVVVEDVRGRHRSQGEFVPVEYEAEDGADLIEWAAAQSWSNGRVGAYGYSYCGLDQLLAAGAGAPLESLAPALSPAGLGEGCLLQGGVQALAFTVGWAVELGALRIGAGATGEESRALTPDVLRQLVQVRPPTRLLARAEGCAAPWLRHWLAGDPHDPYWQRPSHRPRYDRITAPALHLAGAYDTFRGAAVRHHTALRAARGDGAADYLRFGPWSHEPASPSWLSGPLEGPDPRDWDIDVLQTAFFDARLRDVGSQAPAVVAGILNSRDSWTGPAWPPPEAAPMRWHLSGGGRAGSAGGLLDPEPPGDQPPDHLVYDHGRPVPALGGDDCCDPALVGMGPADQRPIEARRDLLAYTSAPLEQDTLVLGDVVATLHIEARQAHSQWLARLCLVTRAGVSVNLCEGVKRVADSAGPVAIDLGPVAARFGRGERLRLHVTCGSAPRWLDLAEAATGEPAITRAVVRHDGEHPSMLVVPVL